MNPFLINHYISPAYFCDREEETKTLLRNIENNTNTAFFAQRRLGKTALIQHVFHLLKKKKQYQGIYLDIYATQNLTEFTQQLANRIYQEFPENKSMGKRFMEAIKLLRPVISIDQVTGNPELSLDIGKTGQHEKTIPRLLSFLDAQDIKVVIAIDEFQQILTYPEKNTEAILRTAMQQLKNINFIFCGSHQKMMHELFNNIKRPFYASTKSINLRKIDRLLYAPFIKNHFQQHKFQIGHEAIALLLELTDGHTYYTQHLCHDIFAVGEKKIDINVVAQVHHTLLKENEGIYFQYRNLLTSAQWQLLIAIAKEEKVQKPYAKDFIYAHHLGTPAGVKRSLESLLDKEMVYHQLNSSVSHYEVYDKFLMRWLQLQYK